MSRGRTLNGQNITAGLLRDTESLQQLIRTEQAYKFLKNIRGSPAYWQSELYDVLAMLRSLGIPTFFLTLSAADLHWPEMIQAIGAECGMDIPTDVVRKMTVTGMGGGVFWNFEFGLGKKVGNLDFLGWWGILELQIWT